MERNAAGVALVAVFAIAVIGVAASSIHTAPIRTGFGIEGGSGVNGTVSVPNSSGGPGGSGGGVGGGGPGGLGGGGFGGSAGGATGGSVPLVVLAVLASVAVAGIALVFWATGDDAPAGPASAATEPTDGDDTRPETPVPVEPANEVYRAWWEMARRTGLPHAASRSPAEFAAAAVDRGMNPDAVAELTRLFRAARYGGAVITDDAERRATAALDRVRAGADADRETDR